MPHPDRLPTKSARGFAAMRPGELQEIRDAARRGGVSVSEFLRLYGLKAAREINASDR